MNDSEWSEYAKDEWVNRPKSTPVPKFRLTTKREFGHGVLTISDHRETVELSAGTKIEIHSTAAVHLGVPASTWDATVVRVDDFYIVVDYHDEENRVFRVSETCTRYLGWTGILYRVLKEE